MAGLLVAVVGCAGRGTDTDGSSGSEGYGDASDSDVDTDADTDADTDSDTDADSDADTDLDTVDTPPDEPPAETGDTGAEDCGPEEITSWWLSPDDSNSMASPALVRLATEVYGTPTGQPVRAWEFLNYYTFDYPASEPDTVALDVQLAQDADLPAGEYRLQIAVTSEGRDALARQPMNLALSIDTSVSMSGAGIDLATDACLAIAASLVDGDVISVVTWSTSQTTLLSGWTVSGPSDPIVTAVCDGLVSNGGTDLHAGLVAAYDLVGDHLDPSRVNRVVLVSDGGANVGVTDADLIGSEAGDLDEDGVYMVGIGVGAVGSYNDALMDTVTDLGRGASLFVGTTDEAWRMLHDRFEEVFDVAAREVQVRLDLPPGFEIVAFSGEELSTDPTEIEPQHLAPNDSVVFYQHVRACDPALVTDDTPLTVAVTFKDEETFAASEVERAYTFGELLGGPVRQLRRGGAVFAYAEAVRLRTPEAVDAAYARLAEADALYPGDAELAEIRTVLDAL